MQRVLRKLMGMDERKEICKKIFVMILNFGRIAISRESQPAAAGLMTPLRLWAARPVGIHTHAWK